MDKNPRKICRVCCLLMAFLFAYSASVQLNDPDWYFWFPLYTLASVVNLMNNFKIISKSRRFRQMIRAILGLSMFLLVKVVAEDLMTLKCGLLSVDLSQRVVREKIGSSLVMTSMFMHLQDSSKLEQLTNWVDFGMIATVIFSYGLPFCFFTIQKGEINI